MTKLTITDIRAIPGDSAFLLDDGTTSILYDSGFLFTGNQIAETLRAQLGTRSLDYILLTHSHYDHALAAAQVLALYPDARIVAHHHAAQVLRKPSALAQMHRLNNTAARQMGFPACTPWFDEIPVHIPVEGGDRLLCGDLEITVVPLPGHTRCCVGYYLPQHGLLLSAETLGVYFGDGICLPAFLVGYQMTLDSIQRVRRLDPARMLLPHYGVVERPELQVYLERCEAVTRQTAEKIVTLLQAGQTREDILALMSEEDHPTAVKQVYPMEAYRVNTSIMIDLIRSELLP